MTENFYTVQNFEHYQNFEMTEIRIYKAKFCDKISQTAKILRILWLYFTNTQIFVNDKTRLVKTIRTYRQICGQ